MEAEELRALQKPYKDKYRSAPEAAHITLRAQGRIGEGLTCKVETGKALVAAGLPVYAWNRWRTPRNAN